MVLTRRSVLTAGSALVVAGGGRAVRPGEDVIVAGAPRLQGAALPPWRPGTLEIHHLAYGRGNSTFVLGPDATTLLIDAGATADGLDVSGALPEGATSAGGYIAEYARRRMAATGRDGLDFAAVTHFHPDHIGDVLPGSATHPSGGYRLTGIGEVDFRLPIKTLVDRGWPDYHFPAPLADDGAYAENYLAYIRERARSGARVERCMVGSATQFARHGEAEEFQIRPVAANGEVARRDDPKRENLFPPLESLAPDLRPDENSCSAAFLIQYGRFRYFTGGDLGCDTREGRAPWLDVETPVARAVGPVDVATVDHHGYFDAAGPGFLAALRPPVSIIQAWHVTHPGQAQLERLTTNRVYAAPRDVFVTEWLPANRLLNARFARGVRSGHGHVVVRVVERGSSFEVLVLDPARPTPTVLSAWGPYASGAETPPAPA